MSLGPVSSSSYNSPHRFGINRAIHYAPQYGGYSTDGFTNSQQGSSFFSKLWKGAALIGGGLLSLKFFKPEWFKSITSGIGEYIPNSVTELFKPVSNAVQGAFESVKSWFTPSSATKAATEEAKATAATVAENSATRAGLGEELTQITGS